MTTNPTTDELIKDYVSIGMKIKSKGFDNRREIRQRLQGRLDVLEIWKKKHVCKDCLIYIEEEIAKIQNAIGNGK